MKNIELKVKIEINKVLADLKKLNTLYFGELSQTDTYFLLGRKRLKIREEGGKSEIIYYVRDDIAESKQSKYFKFYINRIILPFVKLFLHAFLGKKKIIKKHRNLHYHAHTRIHLDNVEKLGEFLELETVIDNHHDQDYFIDEHNRVIKALSLSDCLIISNSYSDL
jgi:predicted adenylyl cyclase CyaB